MDNIAGTKSTLTWAVHISVLLLVVLWLFPTVGLLISSFRAADQMATSGWWTGYAGLGAIPFLLVDNPNWNWPDVYQAMALIMLVLATIIFFVKEPINNRESTQSSIQVNYQQHLATQGHKPFFILLILPLIIAVIAHANIKYPLWPSQISHDYQFMTSFTLVLILSGILIKLLKNISLPSSEYSEPTNIN